ncbi:MAG TPA: hypothetical protein VLL05_10995, partial [Terriglobales bacterium]|nr:hypothetical protein [Terriglobales bacterium]
LSVLVLATAAQKWKLNLMRGQRVDPQPLITLRSKYGMQMQVEARASAHSTLRMGHAIQRDVK